MTQTYALLNKIGLKDVEIDSMININPDLRKCDAENIYENLVMVSKAGFPDDELSWLAYNNPKFLTLTKEELKQKIDLVNEKYEDFDDILKQNADLI